MMIGYGLPRLAKTNLVLAKNRRNAISDVDSVHLDSKSISVLVTEATMLNGRRRIVLPFLLVAFLMVSLQGTTQTQASENEQTLWKHDVSIVAYVTSTEMDFQSRCTESTSEIAFRRFLAKARFVFASRGNP